MAKSKRRFGRGTGKPHPVDVHAGERVRLRRKLLGMTQTHLGDALGLTFQQVQKYERGANRIGAGRLYDLARVFDVSIDFFFALPRSLVAGEKKLIGYESYLMVKRETLEFVRAYYKIEDADVRKGVYQLTKAMGAAGV